MGRGDIRSRGVEGVGREKRVKRDGISREEGIRDKAYRSRFLLLYL